MCCAPVTRPRYASATTSRRSTWDGLMALHDVHVRDVHAYYGTAHVLFGVSLELRGGTTTALLGRNGAGKTTLLKSIANAGVRTTGTVRYGEQDLRSLPPHRVARAGVQLVP